MTNNGIIIEVTDGMRKGQFGIAYTREQEDMFRQSERLYVHFYEDESLEINRGKGLVSIKFCKLIGYVN